MLPWNGDDAQILALVARDPRAGQPILYDRFAKDVHRLVRHVLGPDSECDDVVHQAFIEVFRGVDKVRDADRLRSWIVSVALNVSRGELRRRQRRQRGRQSDTDPAARHVDDHEGRDLVARTYAILERLPADHRAVFVLRHIEHLKLQEIADVLGRSLATVNRWLSRADERFRRMAARDEALAERLGETRGGPR